MGGFRSPGPLVAMFDKGQKGRGGTRGRAGVARRPAEAEPMERSAASQLATGTRRSLQPPSCPLSERRRAGRPTISFSDRQGIVGVCVCLLLQDLLQSCSRSIITIMFVRDSCSKQLDSDRLAADERPESTRVPKVFLKIARKSILFEQKT